MTNQVSAAIIAALLFAASPTLSGATSPSGHITALAADSGVTVGLGDTPLMTILCGPATLLSEGTPVEISYAMTAGKRSQCSNSFRPVSYLLASGDTLGLRLYDDGAAWFTSRPVEVEPVSPAHMWLQRWTDCYEEFFPRDRAVNSGDRFGYPALFEYEGGKFALLSESGLTRNSAASSLHATSPGRFLVEPDGPGAPGWQTLIAGSLADVVGSTLIADNSLPANTGADYSSWALPGVASWIYWANNHGSNDYEIIKEYVDLAASLGLPYVLIDAEWDEMKAPHTVADAVAYARSRGVKPMIWYNSSVGWVNGAPGPKFRLNNPADREREFAWLDSIGVAGVKIDFFSGDNNDNIAYMADLLDAAARHRLMVNFHGVTIPRGWQRTYPNLMTMEAVYGAEWYNNVPTYTPRAASHCATLPFTRNVIGPMDYTPCAFSDSQHPHITTNAHELALTVLFESPLQHIADRPSSLLAQPAEVRAFFGQLPTAWDDTRLISGYPGESAVIARRKGTTWYVAGINGTDSPLTVGSSAPWLPEGRVTLFTDAPAGSENRWNVTAAEAMPASLSLLPRGGFVAVIENP